MLALLLIATAPDVVEHCAAQARRHARVSAGALAEACTASVLDGQMLASCQRVLAEGAASRR